MKRHNFVHKYDLARHGCPCSFFYCGDCGLGVTVPIAYDYIDGEIIRKPGKLPSRTDCDEVFAKRVAKRLLGEKGSSIPLIDFHSLCGE